jgi:hypothetical protein
MAQVLRAVDRYPSWHGGFVRRVVVRERDEAGYPSIVEAMLRVAIGPIAGNVELALAVIAECPDRVELTRLPNDSEDEETFVAVWHIEDNHRRGTTIRLDIEADLDVPRLVPMGDLGNKLARGFVDAAATAGDALGR